MNARVRMGTVAVLLLLSTASNSFAQQADSAAGRISILTPVGTALIGLSEGQSMTWSDRSGKAKRLTVLEVKNRPETVA